MVNKEDIDTYLDILGDRKFYCLVAKNHETEDVETAWLAKDAIVDFVEKMNNKGYQVWCSLNDKEPHNDSIEGTKALCVLFFDVDAKRKDKNVPATEEELIESLKEAEKLKSHIENKYRAKGFMALSGNGFHVYFPLPRYELPDAKSRLETNEKLKAFCKKIAEECGVTIDKTYDLRRLSSVIGSRNLKIPDKPRAGLWNPEDKPSNIVRARKQNKALLEAILDTATTALAPSDTEPSELEQLQAKAHKSLDALAIKDEKLKDLYELDFKTLQSKYGYPSRSEAEFALLTKLVQYGFSDIEIYDVMEESKIYSWRERPTIEKSRQIHRAREKIANSEKSKVEDTQLIKKVWEVATSPYLLDYIHKDITRTVKKDFPSKISSLMTALSAYTRDPLNNSLKGPNSVGKTTNVIETVKYFDRNDVKLLIGLTPKSIVYEHGVLMDENNEPIPLENRPIKPKRRDFPSGDSGAREYDQAMENYRQEKRLWNLRLRNSYTLINLENRILVFLEPPSEEALRFLLPILSHDKKRVEYNFVEPKTLKTRKVIIEGWPSAIFLSTDRKYMKDFVSRNLTTTPESDPDKIEQANLLTNLQVSRPWDYKEETEEAKIIRRLLSAIKSELVEKEVDVVIPFEELYKMFPREIVTDMRHFKHFVRFLKTFTALHLFQRPILKKKQSLYAISSIDDVILSMAIYSRIFETTRTGTQEKTLKFYHDIVKREPKWLKKELVAEYNKTAKRKLGSDAIGKMLKRLEEIQYVDVQPYPEDKRFKVYIPLVKGEEKLEIERNLENLANLRRKLENSFENWIKNIGRNNQFLLYNFSNNRLSLENISSDVAKQMVLKNYISKDNKILPSIFKELSLVKTEKQTEKGGELENRMISSDSDSEFWCPICKQLIEPNQSKVLLPPKEDGVCAHTSCYEAKGEKDVFWWEYARKFASSLSDMREYIASEMERRGIKKRCKVCKLRVYVSDLKHPIVYMKDGSWAHINCASNDDSITEYKELETLGISFRHVAKGICLLCNKSLRNGRPIVTFHGDFVHEECEKLILKQLNQMSSEERRSFWKDFEVKKLSKASFRKERCSKCSEEKKLECKGNLKVKEKCFQDYVEWRKKTQPPLNTYSEKEEANGTTEDVNE